VIHSDFVDGLKSALHAEEEVYVALARVTGEEMTSYVVVRDAEGEHHLPGIGCDRESFLRTQLGERYDSTMDMIIGMTSDRRIHEALAAGGIT
jgi:hypothetical protein